jgi:secreted PhoX family phosphatase
MREQDSRNNLHKVYLTATASAASIQATTERLNRIRYEQEQWNSSRDEERNRRIKMMRQIQPTINTIAKSTALKNQLNSSINLYNEQKHV